jgi:hypothetical protein
VGFSESGLDLWEIADNHELEDQLVDLSFYVQESMCPVALPTTWVPGKLSVGRSGRLLTRSPTFLAGWGWPGPFGTPRRLPVSLNFALIWLTSAGLILPLNPAACRASFTAATGPIGFRSGRVRGT